MSSAASRSLWTASTSSRWLSASRSTSLVHLRYASTVAKTSRIEKRQIEDVAQEEDPAEGIRKVTLSMQNDAQWDPWSQPIATLDVMLPYRTAPWSGSRYQSIKARFQQIWDNRLNAAKNSFNKFIMYRYNSFPGIDLEEFGGLNYLLKVPVQIFTGTKSASKPSSWLSGLRNEVFDAYCEAQKAVANKDRTALGSYTQSHYFNDCIRLLRKQGSTLRYVWNLHTSGPTSTTEHKTTILSIRAIEGHLGAQPPADGNRLAIQVLAKIETLQSLEMYDASGKSLHSASPTASTDAHQKPVIASSIPNKLRHKRVPAPAYSQTEYLIFEKKMYMTGQKWSIRERIYPKEGAIVAA
ncbi:hypothetical protein PM082_007385 [Marasmius tenuissimus]|nr:hypothetical protein PM082_007385 [Marasmius tenuissimus]